MLHDISVNLHLNGVDPVLGDCESAKVQREFYDCERVGENNLPPGLQKQIFTRRGIRMDDTNLQFVVSVPTRHAQERDKAMAGYRRLRGAAELACVSMEERGWSDFPSIKNLRAALPD